MMARADFRHLGEVGWLDAQGDPASSMLGEIGQVVREATEPLGVAKDDLEELPAC